MKILSSVSATILSLMAIGVTQLSTPKVVYADKVNSNYHVAKYHLTTKDGWSNDLQSIVWNSKGKYYDLYFLHSQTADESNEAGHQNWYHTTTKDFVHFTRQNEAIKAAGPDKPYTWASAWTGTVLKNNGQIQGVPKDAKVAYFSGLEKNDGGSQNIWAAYSTDNGKTFSHILNNAQPVIDHSWKWTSQNHTDERDPGVVYWHGKLLMYVAEGDVIGVYQSKNGLTWQKADKKGASKIISATYMNGLNSKDSFPVECPVLRTMTMPNGKKKQVLFYGAKAPNEGQTTGTYYVVGHLNKNGLFEAETKARRLDQGSDYYGANFTGSADLKHANRTLKTMGWIGNWSYTAAGIHNDEEANSEFTKHLGSYSVARNLKLNNKKFITQTPIIKLTKKTKYYQHIAPARTSHNKKNSRYKLLDLAKANVNQVYDLDFYNTRGNYRGRIYIDIWQGKDWIKFNYNPATGWYRVNTYAGELDNSRNGQKASSAYYDGMLGDGKGYQANSGISKKEKINLKVLTDKNSVEIFFPNGQVYTVARFNTSNRQDFKIFTQNPNSSNRVNVTQTSVI